jgi:hypothetical protein
VESDHPSNLVITTHSPSTWSEGERELHLLHRKDKRRMRYDGFYTRFMIFKKKEELSSNLMTITMRSFRKFMIFKKKMQNFNRHLKVV